MRISHINLSHVLNHHALNVAVQPDTRVLLVCGGNGAGKTAIAQSVKLALTGALVRGVRFKNQLSELVTLGEKDGIASVTVMDGSEEKTFRLNLRYGNYSGEAPTFTGDPLSLDPEDFIALDTNERRRTLFRMAGIKVKPEDIVQDLVKAGHALDHVQRIAPALRHGFESASSEAKTAATEARGGWKVITGETYGSTKGEHWKATPPKLDVTEPVDVLQRRVNECREALEVNRQELTDLRQAAQAHQAVADARGDYERLDKNRAALKKLDAKAAKLKKELDALRNDAQQSGGQTCACPACGVMLYWNEKGTLREWDKAKPEVDPPKAYEAMQEKEAEIAAVTRQVAKQQQAIANGEAVAKLIDNLPSEPAPGAAREAEGLVRKAESELVLLQADLDAAKGGEQAISQADERTAKAATLHAEVSGFSELATALQELPGKYIASALTGVQELLDEASEAFDHKVTIGTDMQLRYGQIPYWLASESQQWRMQAAMGYALGVIGGSGIMVLDRFDVLEPRARGPVLKWLSGQTKMQVLLCGTLKEAPKLPEPPFQVAWLDAP